MSRQFFFLYFRVLIKYKLKYFYILFFILFTFSCSKEKEKISVTKENTAKTFFDFYKSDQNLKKPDNDKMLIKSFDLIRHQKNDSNNRGLLSLVIIEFYKNNNIVKLDESSKLLLKLSFESHDTLNLGMAFRSRGNFYYKTHKLDSSYFYYSKAEKIYFKLKDNDNYANILMNKGIIEYSIGDYLGSELSLNKAQIIFRKTNNFNKIYGSFDQLGLVATELKEYERGFYYFNKALESLKNLPSKEDRIYYNTVCKNNIGYLYLKSKDYKNAIFYFEKALKNKLIIKDDPLLYSNLVDNLAYCRLKSNVFNNLPSLFFEALNIREKLNDNTDVVVSNIHLSEYYFSRKNIEKSIIYSKKAVDIAKKANIPLIIVSALKQASFVDKKNSSKYSEEYIRISDSLQIAERNSKDRFDRIKLDTEEIIKEKNSIEESSRDILNYFVGTLAVIGFLFFMRTQRARRREAILKLAQQQANEDIYKLIISQQGKLNEGKIMEKNRIAKELHDGVLGRLFGLRLNLDGLNLRTDEDAIKERIRCLEELKTIEQDLREISHELSREKIVLINNFVAIVNGLLEEQTKVNKAILMTSIGDDIDWDLLSNTTKINLYRILQECLQNINKYAEAKTIKVDFKKDKNGNLFLNIVDDGLGFEVDKKSGGIGMKNIVARAHESDGTIEIKSEKNKGTRIKITVPLDHKSIKI